MKKRVHISQIELVSGIFKLLERQGLKDAPIGVLNKVISCADEIIAEINRELIFAKDGEGYHAWIKSDDTGESSKFLADVLRSNKELTADRIRVPYDPSDFGRCVRMLRVCSELKKDLPKIKGYGPIWREIFYNWEYMEDLYDKAVGTAQQINWESSGELFDFMQKIHREAK